MFAWIVRWGLLLTSMTTLLIWFARLLTSGQPFGSGTGMLAYGNGLPHESHIYLHDIAKDTITQLTIESAGYYGLDWSPDGTFLAYSRTEIPDHGVYIQEVSTGIMQRLNRDRYPNLISWSPDACCLAYTIPITNEKYQTESIAFIDLQTHEITPLEPGRLPRFHPLWSADGRYIIYSHNTEYVLGQYINMQELSTGAIAPLFWLDEGQLEALALSPGGKAVLLTVRYKDDSRSLMIYDVAQERTELLSHDDNWYVAADWSPDGRYIALSNSGDDPNLAGDIELFDVQRRLLVRLAAGFTPAWQPARS
jgi:Tol biopolymer transport system component